MALSTRCIALFLAIMTTFVLLAPARAQQTNPPENNANLAQAFAPGGQLRVAINLGNGVLAQQDPQSGELGGVSVMLARAIADELGIGVSFMTYGSAGLAFADAANNVWDLTFMGLEPERATEVNFSRPYVYIQGTYLVRADASYRNVVDVDAPGVTIAAGNGSAYDLFLSRNIERAELARRPTSAQAIVYFLEGNSDVVAGVRQTLQDTARGRSDLRVLDDSFMRIEQAIAVPGDRADTVTEFLNNFIEKRLVSGFIRAGLDATDQSGAVVPQ